MSTAEFDQYSRTYQEDLASLVGDIDYFSDYKAKHAAEFVDPATRPKILDYGCGIGLVAGSFRRFYPQSIMHGFDPSPESLNEMASSLKDTMKVTHHSELLDSDYDLIVISNVLHHVVPGERATVFGTIHQRLKPGGHLLVFEHNPYNPATQWVVKSCVFDQDAVLLTNHEVRTRASRAGLVIRRSDYIVFFPPKLRRLQFLEPWLRWLPLGAQHATLAQKL